jgi:hypothetical protein
MDRNQKRIDSDKMFDSLVRNAFDFLGRSVGDLLQENKSPKYSVIDFCTALELFLKARLLKEHWVLIYDNPKVANLAEFRRGDFRSVAMQDAIARLNNVRNLQISDDARKTFDGIRQHRNRLIHFFHPTFTYEPDNTALQAVVAELCRAWFCLRLLLAEIWRDSFASFLPEIETVDRLMRTKREFLRAIFEARLPDIEKGKKRGVVFSVCGACHWEAAKLE